MAGLIFQWPQSTVLPVDGRMNAIKEGYRAQHEKNS